MTPRQQEYEALRKKGHTYREIAEICGVSYQRVHNALRGPGVSKKRESFLSRIVYPGIADYLRKTGYSCPELAEMVYMTNPTLYTTLMGRRDPSKSDIDAILKVVGGTYEEVFREEWP